MKIKQQFAVWLCLFFAAQNSHGEETTVKKDGAILLKGLFPITFRDMKTGRCDKLDTTNGLLWMMAMTYAVEEINNSTAILPNTTLGYEIDDTCRNIPTAMNHAIDIVAKYRPNSVCPTRQGQICGAQDKARQQRPAAVVGPAASWISIPVASLMALYDILQISYASTSRILSDKSRYKSFMRTVPSDEYQAEAMADFVRHFEWSYVFLIASDDDYGKMAAAAFKASAQKLNICIAFDEFIAFNAERSHEMIRSTLTKLGNSPRTKVVVVFSYLEQGERLLREADSLNITDRTWVTSDAWANGVTKLNISQATLVGLFTFSIKSTRLKGFEEFLRNLSVHKARTNYWWRRFLEEELGCKITNVSASGSNVRPCEAHETLPADHRFGSDVIVNVMDAVRTAASALNNILSTCAQRNHTCSVTSIPADLLLTSAKNSSFTSADGTPVRFNQAGDVTTIKYVIRNVQLGADGALTYAEVGAWNRTDGEKHFVVEDERIVWNSRMKPRSTCFRECRPGEHVVGQSECCWNCQKCEKGKVSSVSGSFECTKCNETHYANQAQTLCLLRHVVYLRPSHPAAVAIVTLSCIGITCTAVIAVIFVRMRESAALVSSSVSLVFVFFSTLFLSFAFAAAHVSVPSHGACVGLDSLLHLLLIMYAAFLLANTKATTRALMSAVSRVIDMRIAYVHGGLVGGLVVLQVVFIIAWQATSPSRVRLANQEESSRLLECSAAFPASRVVPTVFPLLILSLATIVAFRERNLTENFNEAKFTSFATIALCILLVAFFPTYWYVVGITRILVVAFTVFVAAFSCMGCIFIPKLYIIFVRPKRNTDNIADPTQDDRSLQLAACPDNHPNNHLNSHLNSLPNNGYSDEQTRPEANDVTTAVSLTGTTQMVRFDLNPVAEQVGREETGSSNSAYEKDEDGVHALDIVSL